MATRVNIGGAFYELDVDSKGFASGLRAAEAEAKTGTAKIGAAFDKTASQISQRQAAMGAVAAQESKRVAAEWAQSATKIGVSFDQASNRFRSRGGLFISEAQVNKEIALAKRAADQISAQAQRAQVASTRSQQSDARVRGALSGAVGFGAAAAGVTLGAVAINEAGRAIVGAITQAKTAQLALNGAFAGGEQAVQEFANVLADRIGKSRTETLQAAVATSTLTREYGFSTDQAMELLKITADLAAAKGMDLPNAIQRTTSAMRGEAESAEQLGLVLNDQAVAVRTLGKEDARLFELMSDQQKAQLRLLEIRRQSAVFEGKAEERARSALGAFDRLGKSTNELSVSIGDRLLPGLGSLANDLATVENAALRTMKGFDDWSKSMPATSGLLAGIAKSASLAAFDILHLGNQIRLVGAIAGAIGGAAGVIRSTDPEATAGEQLANSGRSWESIEDRRAAEAERNRVIRVAKETVQAKAALSEREKDFRRYIDAVDRAYDKHFEREREVLQRARDVDLEAWKQRSDGAIKAIQQEKQERLDAVDDEIDAAQRARDGAVKEADKRRDGVIKNIEQESEAHSKLTDQAIKDAERMRDAAVDAAEDARDAAMSLLDAEEDARSRARQVADRGQSDSRRDEDRERDDSRLAEDRAREAADDADKDSDKAKADRAKKRADEQQRQAEKQIDRLEKLRDETIKGIDAEKDARQVAADLAIRSIDDQSDAEQARHDQIMRDLQSEEDQRTGAIDAQLAALDAVEKAENLQERDLQLAEDLTEAQKELATAREVAAGIGNDPKLVQSALERLAAAEKAIEDERRDREKANIRESLQDQRKAISDELAGRRQAAKTALDIQLDYLEKKKQAEQDALKVALDTFDIEMERTKEDADAKIESIRSRSSAERSADTESRERTTARSDFESQAVADQRLIEDRALSDKRLAEDRGLADSRSAEDTALEAKRAAVTLELDQELEKIKAHYDGDGGVIPTIKLKSDEIIAEFKRRREKAQEELDLERDGLKEQYDGPEGIITFLKQKTVDINREMTARLESAQAANELERKSIEAKFQNNEKTGLLDLLEQSKKDHEEKLRLMGVEWDKWKDKVAGDDGAIPAAQKALDKFIESLKGLGADIDVDIDATTQNTSTDQQPDRNRPVQGGPIGSGGGAVPGPWKTAFGFNQPYNGPFAGAAWPGGPKTHRGVDITLPGQNNGMGTTYGAFRGGTVVAAGWMGGPSGYGIIMQADDGLYDTYFHNQSVLVKPGDRVSAGQNIAVLGETGTEGFPHVHYEVRRNPNGDPEGQLIDPVPFMNGATGATARPGGQQATIDLFGRRITLTQAGIGGLGSSQFGTPTGGNAEVQDYIRAAAIARGINPNIALEIARRESAGTFSPNIAGDHGSSFGSFQLHYGGLASGVNAGSGLGDIFTARTGLHARDAATFRQQIDFALDEAKRGGWGPWNAWTGDPWEGLPRHRNGTMIREPTLLVGSRSGPYGWAGETGQPERLLGVEETRQERLRGSGGDTWNIHGIGMNEVAAEIERRQRRKALLRAS